MVEIIIMIEVGNEIGSDWVVVIDIEDEIIEIELSMEKTIQKGVNMVWIIEEETLGEQTIEENRIIEDKPLEEDIEGTTRIVSLIGIETGQEIDTFQIILGGIIAGVIGQDQGLKQVPREPELDALRVGNMIILLRFVQR